MGTSAIAAGLESENRVRRRHQQEGETVPNALRSSCEPSIDPKFPDAGDRMVVTDRARAQQAVMTSLARPKPWSRWQGGTSLQCPPRHARRVTGESSDQAAHYATSEIRSTRIRSAQPSKVHGLLFESQRAQALAPANSRDLP
jgi:hypothetical protein